jgi:phosphatidylglycerol:prolipoprotein diacylglycerol transferase
MFQSPSEIAIQIFNFPVYYYGIILAFAILTGVYVADFLYRKYYDKVSYIFDFIPYVIIFGIIGARLYYCLVNFSYYKIHLTEVFNIRQGGLSIHGMIIFGILALWIFSKKYKIQIFKLLDSFLCATALAQSIGRWGNFFNSEAFGAPTNLPWKLYIPVSHRPLEYINFDYFHPTFLYESILDFLIFITLLALFKKYSKTPGKITALYLILYSLVRIFVEHFRIDSILNVFNIPIAQVMSFILLFIGIILLATRKN